jgi:hypothetical protein
MQFFVDFALFFRTIDGLLRYDRLRYGTLKNSDNVMIFENLNYSGKTNCQEIHQDLEL